VEIRILDFHISTPPIFQTTLHHECVRMRP
jgi:hypothetical protein